MNKDLTIGNPQKILWKFCLPLFASVIFQQLYNIADSLIAGKFISENALAAVGNSYEITLIFIALAFGCNIGCSVIVSRYFGAKDSSSVKTTVTTTFISTGLLCVLLVVLGLLLGDYTLGLIKTPAEIFEDSSLYLKIYVIGLPFLFFYNIATGIFSALGDSKTPFIFLAISSVTNIFVDILFVLQFNMGVAGVALATFICQGISCVLAVIVVFKRLSGLTSGIKAAVFSQKIFKQIISIAIPSMLQQSFISIGNIVLQSFINSYGPGTIAGYAAGVKLNNLVITSLTTVGNGISNYTSQNLGAGKITRIKEGFTAGLKMVWSLCIPFAILYFLAGRFLLNIFMETPTTDAMSTGIIYLKILAPFYIVVATKLTADGVLRGYGKMKQFMISTFSDLILRVTFAAIFSNIFASSIGIWCAWPIGWTIGTILSVIFYKQTIKQP